MGLKEKKIDNSLNYSSIEQTLLELLQFNLLLKPKL
jgi:hypothetical protein